MDVQEAVTALLMTAPTWVVAAAAMITLLVAGA
jgi:hypothetical protein